MTAGSVLKDIPAKVWWTLIGGLIGVIFTIIILNIPGAPSWAVFVGIGGIVFGIVIGFILGKAHDSGKEDWGTGRGGKRF